ncbi:MAG: DUF3783 domain-containing protein [Desulfobacterales bacterium]
MAGKGKFSRIGKTSPKPMFGPRVLMAVGFDEKHKTGLLDLLERLGFRNLPVVQPSAADQDRRVADILERSGSAGAEQTTADLPLTVLMSGMSEKELHRLISAWKDSPLPRPLWATLTPTSAQWPLSRLLLELVAERKAMEVRRNR